MSSYKALYPVLRTGQDTDPNKDSAMTQLMHED